MAWGTVNVDEQRVRFVVSASEREKSMQQLCEEFEISRATGYEWLRRYQGGGIAGVVEKSRRPHDSKEKTRAEIEQRVIELREQRGDWGARKLQVILRGEQIDLPVITVHGILLRRGLVRAQDKHARAVERFERGAANQLWQMDLKSAIGWEARVGQLWYLTIQQLRGGAARDLVDASRARETGANRGFRTLRSARRDADGSRDAVVEHASGGGLDVADSVADKARDQVAFKRIPAYADTGQSGTISRGVGCSGEAQRIRESRVSAGVAG